MAITSLKSNYWDNSDGLRVEFPGDAGVVTRGGELDFDGAHLTRAIIDLTALPTLASANKQIILENCVIPDGAFIQKVVVTVLKETTGSNANLDVGFVKTDRATELDYNGLLAAADAFNGGTDIGGVYTYGQVDGTLTTEGGVLLGTVLAYDGILVAAPETADFTAGKIQLDIYWHILLAADI